MFKDLFNALHDVIHTLAHLALVPVVALLDGSISVLTKLSKEIQKI